MRGGGRGTEEQYNLVVVALSKVIHLDGWMRVSSAAAAASLATSRRRALNHRRGVGGGRTMAGLWRAAGGRRTGSRGGWLS